MICTKVVFRCFRRFEKVADRITGAAGPVFIALAVCLLSVGAICFFETIQPTLQYPWITTPICLLIASNLFVHYYLVCTVSPGFVDDPPREVGTGFLWAARSRASARDGTMLRSSGVRWSEDMNVVKASISKCKRCGQMRPERSHHCRICNRCVLKYDHHCPGLINVLVCTMNAILCSLGKSCAILRSYQCHDHISRMYLCLSTFCFAFLGWTRLRDVLGFTYNLWTFYTPEHLFVGLYILSTIMCLALFIMFGWHLWCIASGETSVEAQDHEHYRMMARVRGHAFVNSYDLGKVKNLQLFFNVLGDRYPLYTLIFPFRIPPYTDGRSWARRPGYENHVGVGPGEELTDSDED